MYFNANSVLPDQTPCSAESDLVKTVCLCPFSGMLGLAPDKALFSSEKY